MRKNRNAKTVFTVCAVIALLFFIAFAARLADWQLVHGDEYRSLSEHSTGSTVKTDATRGEILDRNGVGLVVNKTHYRVVIDKLYADESKLNDTVLMLIKLLGKTGDKWNDALPIAALNGAFTYKKNSEAAQETLRGEDCLNLPPETDAAACVDALCKRYGVTGEYTQTELRDILSVRYGMEQSGYSASNPFTLAESVSSAAVSAVSENTQGVGGVEIQTYLVRGAAKPSLAPHILGALGAISEEEYNAFNAEGKDYALTDWVGKFGVELAYEDTLRGSGGTKVISRNSDGTIIDTVETVDAKPGNTVWLTLDSGLQAVAAHSLEENVRAAREYGEQESAYMGEKLLGEDCESGAVVMLDVSDFSVLAAASYPTYDLNKYSDYGDYYVRLSEDKNAPLFNRAFSGTFAWGSVFKPCVALAALEEKTITDKTNIKCTQFYDYYPTNVVECMHYHGDETVTAALTQSCNYFFAETGRRLGAETMYLYAERLGFGEYTGLEVEESKGTLAGRDSATWQAGNTVQAAIGQSDNAFTPVQLATYAATLANGGVRLKTHIVSKITDYQRGKVLADYSDPVQVSESGVSAKNQKIVKEAMRNVAQSEDGTAYSVFGDYPVAIAAKTGTAENAGSDHTTFICYAPYDKPEVAIAVVLEHGVKGRYSMQVAKDLLDEYFKMKK